MVALAVQLIGLYSPSQPGPQSQLPLDKIAHFTMFAAVAVTALGVGWPARWVGPLLAAHAGLSEVVQAQLLPNRAGDPGDVVADLIGTAVGLLLGWAVSGRSRRGDEPRLPDAPQGRG